MTKITSKSITSKGITSTNATTTKSTKPGSAKLAGATLTDRQLMLLSAASQRDDRLIVLPEHLKVGAAKTVFAKLLAHGLVEEVRVGRNAPHWRMDEEEQALGLQVTAAGLRAIGVEEDEPSPDDADHHAELPEGSEAAVSDASGPEAPDADVGMSSSSPQLKGVRAGSKQALVLSLLCRPEGATIDDLLSATGWLPHTTRAALTGLRQKGYAITRAKDKGAESVYRIAPGEAPSPGEEINGSVAEREASSEVLATAAAGEGEV